MRRSLIFLFFLPLPLLAIEWQPDDQFNLLYASDRLGVISGHTSSLMQSALNNNEHLVNIYRRLITVSEDTYDCSSRLYTILNDLQSVKSKVNTLATESTLSSIDSKLDNLSLDFDTDGLATESTLQSAVQQLAYIVDDGIPYLSTQIGDLIPYIQSVSDYAQDSSSKLDYLATEDTLQSVLSAVQSISTDGLATESTLLSLDSRTSEIRDLMYGLASSADIISVGSSLENIYWSLPYLPYATENTLQSVYDLVEEDSQDWKEWRDKFWSDSFSASLASSFSTSYAKIGFASNATPEQVDLEYSSMDFFSASLKLIADGNKINSAATMFLKHINEKMPNLKEHDTSEDENRISNSIDDASGKLDTLKQTFDDFSEISFKEDVEDYFDSSVVLKNFQDVHLPAVINITIPSFGSFGAQVLSIQTSKLEGFLDVSRSVFACLYFVILAGFILFVFKLFVPVLSRFSHLLATVLNW